MTSARSVDEVFTAAKSAGLKINQGISHVQVLKFSSALNSVDYRLVELPPELQDALDTGDKVVIRGDQEDEAVLCSQTATYEMKVVDLSNTMLICPGLSTLDDENIRVGGSEEGVRQLEVPASIDSYYELRPCRPRFNKLKQILKSTAYCGPEEDNHANLYSLDDLLGSIQASESELLAALQDFGAFQANGRWRVMDVQYQEGAVMAILNALDEKMWSHKAIPLSECCAVLDELYPEFVVKHCLELYGDKCSSGDDTYCLNELKICQFYAEYLLRPVGRFCFDDFLESWQQSVPSGMTTSLQQLKGLALWDLDARPPVIWHFSVKDLPDDPAERFAKLFRMRSKWTSDEIEPFIVNLGTEKISSNALLLKFARMSTDKLGRKVFNSKRPL